MSAFEAALEDQSVIGRALRPPTQRVLSGWLGAGNERVYIGREGWLFYRPDVEYLTGRGFLDPGPPGAADCDRPAKSKWRPNRIHDPRSSSSSVISAHEA